MKKLIALLLAMVLLLSLVSCGGKAIGEVRGAENEYITIDDVKYVLDTDNDFSQADKGTYLGKVSNSKITMKVYSVKGDTNEEYIYALWDWEGAFYKRKQERQIPIPEGGKKEFEYSDDAYITEYKIYKSN